MSDDNVLSFVGEQFRRLNARLDSIEERLTNMELRQTASEHFEQGLMAHIASIHAGIDRLHADMRVVKRRLDLVDAE